MPAAAGVLFFCLPDGQADAVLFFIHGKDADPDHVADGEDLRGMAQEAVGDLGDVHQAVLVDADLSRVHGDGRG